MTETDRIDLAAIKARAAAASELYAPGFTVEASAADVPALLAEVERLRDTVVVHEAEIRAALADRLPDHVDGSVEAAIADVMQALR